MALFRTDPADAGYATAAASLVCLAIAVTVAGFMTYAASEARAAKRGLRQVQAEALLEGGQVLAAAALLDNSKPGRLRWLDQDGANAIEILAEPERDKLDAKAVTGDVARRLGATDATKVTSAIQSGLVAGKPIPIADLAPSELWRQCASSMISYYGGAKEPLLSPAEAPDRTGLRPHVGEVWRIRVSVDGWADDRVVRLTGSGQQPTNLISRSLHRSTIKGEPCATLLTRL